MGYTPLFRSHQILGVGRLVFLYLFILSIYKPISYADDHLPLAAIASQVPRRGQSGLVAVVFLDGRIDSNQNKFSFLLWPKKGSILIEGGPITASHFNIGAKLNHIEIAGIDVLAQLKMEGEISKNQYGQIKSINGRLITYNTIINYKPFKGIDILYEIADSSLKILSLKAEGFNLFGVIELNEPYGLDLILQIQGLEAGELISLLDLRMEEEVSGLIYGKFKIKGTLASPYMKGYLETPGLRIGQASYKWAKVDLQAKWPFVEVIDSRIYNQQGDLLGLRGKMDLRLRDDLKAYHKLKLRLMKAKGAENNLGRGLRAQEVSLRKDISENLSLSFKSFVNEPMKEERARQGQIGLEYRTNDYQKIRMLLEEEGELLGWVHEIRF